MDKEKEYIPWVSGNFNRDYSIEVVYLNDPIIANRRELAKNFNPAEHASRYKVQYTYYIYLKPQDAGSYKTEIEEGDYECGSLFQTAREAAKALYERLQQLI
jgi:hypothetical protein